MSWPVWFGKRVVLVCISALLVNARGLASDWSGLRLSGDASKGRDLFVDRGCIKCHSLWGSRKKKGPDLTQVGMGRSFWQVAGSMWNHSPQMVLAAAQSGIDRPEITPADVRDLIAYLYTLNYFNEPGDFREGKRSFWENGCGTCHSVRGEGKSVGPALRKGSPVYMSWAMWNHGTRMTREMADRGIQIPTFDRKSMADLLAYIRGGRVEGWPKSGSGIPGTARTGRNLFVAKGCQRCHAIHGVGGREGPALSDQGRYLSVTEIAAEMWNHGPAMSLKATELKIRREALSEQEMADLIAYLYFACYSDSPGNRAQGERLFIEKQCSKCHESQGEVQGDAPDLSTSESIQSPHHLIASMWNHAAAMDESMRQKQIPWPEFEGDEMRDLQTYLGSLR